MIFPGVVATILKYIKICLDLNVLHCIYVFSTKNKLFFFNVIPRLSYKIPDLTFILMHVAMFLLCIMVLLF